MKDAAATRKKSCSSSATTERSMSWYGMSASDHRFGRTPRPPWVSPCKSASATASASLKGKTDARRRVGLAVVNRTSTRREDRRHLGRVEDVGRQEIRPDASVIELLHGTHEGEPVERLVSAAILDLRQAEVAPEIIVAVEHGFIKAR